MPPAKLSAATPLTKTYEELDGAQGREVFFRPHRYRAQDLAPLKCTVIVRADDLPVECAIYDVSQSGVAFEWPTKVPLAVDDNLADVEVRFDGRVDFRGAARVGSIREIDDVRIVGVSFVDCLLNMDAVLQVRDLHRFSAEPKNTVKVADHSWSFEGMDRYKALVADFGLYLEDSERKFDDLERRLSFNVVHAESQSAAHEALVNWVGGDFTREVYHYIESIDAASRGAPADYVPRMQAYTQRHLEEFFLKAPWMHRAKFKPFGYPGDYEVMRFFYERPFEGVSLFAKALNYATIRCRTPQAVCRRKDMVKRELKQLIESRGESDQPLRILSVASGPAQELFELFSEAEGFEVPVDVVLFDQDKSALTYAYSRLKPIVEKRFSKQVRLRYLHDSIKRLLRDRQIFSELGPFDGIFSCGLYDYLAPTTAVVLTKSLFARLAPAGRLYVGNMVPENSARWAMEHLLDWHLIYRTRPELMAIGRRAAPDATIRLLEEETGINPFIEILRG